MSLACGLSSGVSPSGWGPATGLDRPFPPQAGAVPSDEQVALGHLLFFDRVLSRGRDVSCADCHRPELALTDGRVKGRGASGPLPRNVPTLYNVGFKDRLFWDRRAPGLEEQAFSPLFAPEEMAADPVELVVRLRAIPGYRDRFARAFPGDEPAEDVCCALAGMNNFAIEVVSG